jgi:hypothetical protein
MRVGFGRGRPATFKRDRLTSTLLERQRSVFKLYWFNACVRVCMQMEKESLFSFCFLEEKYKRTINISIKQE